MYELYTFTTCSWIGMEHRFNGHEGVIAPPNGTCIPKSTLTATITIYPSLLPWFPRLQGHLCCLRLSDPSRANQPSSSTPFFSGVIVHCSLSFHPAVAKPIGQLQYPGSLCCICLQSCIHIRRQRRVTIRQTTCDKPIDSYVRISKTYFGSELYMVHISRSVRRDIFATRYEYNSCTLIPTVLLPTGRLGRPPCVGPTVSIN